LARMCRRLSIGGYYTGKKVLTVTSLSWVARVSIITETDSAGLNRK
jgi:hypothetical protein